MLTSTISRNSGDIYSTFALHPEKLCHQIAGLEGRHACGRVTLRREGQLTGSKPAGHSQSGMAALTRAFEQIVALTSAAALTSENLLSKLSRSETPISVGSAATRKACKIGCGDIPALPRSDGRHGSPRW